MNKETAILLRLQKIIDRLEVIVKERGGDDKRLRIIIDELKIILSDISFLRFE